MAGSGPFLSASWYRAARLRPRLGPQVQIRLHHIRGRPWYVATDPASGRVHRLTPDALGIVASMDGQRTLDTIWQDAAARLGDHAPSQDQVLELLGQLHANDLLIADTVPDTRELLDRFERDRRRRWKGLLNPLSARIRLCNPDRLLGWMLPAVAPLFGGWGLLLWAALVVPAVVLAGHNWTELTTDVGDRILATDNLVLLAICLPVVKALHELGHGFTTKRFGGAVPEVGIMFLMMFPMPYVDASAAAGFPSQRRRVAVGLAGMLVETAVAAAAMLVWAVVEPGLLRALAFNVIVAASVTTVLFNGNPLMRYDGYYVLSDLLNIPNLAQRATRLWSHGIDHFVFRRPDMPPFRLAAGELPWLLAYAPLSFVYRLGVTFGIALFLAGHYWAIGVGLALWNLFASLILPLWKALRHVVAGPGLQRCRRRAVGLTTGALAALVLALLFVPAPHHSMAEGVVWLPETAVVRASTDGFLLRLLSQPGAHVAAGTAIAESTDPALAARIAGLQGRVAELQAQLLSEAFTKRVDALVTETELGQVQADLAQQQTRANELVARSTAPGTLAVAQAADLADRFLKVGDVIGYVLPDEGGRVVRAVVDQDDLDLVRSHLVRAELQIVGYPDQVFTTRIVREVPSGRDTLPAKALGTAGGGTIAIDPRDPKSLHTLRRTFQLDIALPADAPGTAFGARVYIRLDHAWEPLGDQLYRRLRQLLLSRLQA